MQIFPDDNQNQPANNINNQRYNPSLLNHWDMLIIFIIYLNILFFLQSFLLPIIEISVTFLAIIFNGICFPSFFYCFNGKLRQFYLRQFWENAPNCLQPFNPNRIIESNIADNNIELSTLPRKRYSKKSHVQARPRKKRTRF